MRQRNVGSRHGRSETGWGVGRLSELPRRIFDFNTCTHVRTTNQCQESFSCAHATTPCRFQGPEMLIVSLSVRFVQERRRLEEGWGTIGK